MTSTGVGTETPEAEAAIDDDGMLKYLYHENTTTQQMSPEKDNF